MIVAETPETYRFVTQPDHADLAGQFAERWGGGGFARPAPYAAVIAAAFTHDDGWWSFDRRPHLADDETPVDFTELPASTWIELYDRGIETVVDVDRYAGLLVSMHGAGLRRRRYGLSPAWPPTPPAYRAFVDRQESRQCELLSSLVDEGTDDRASDADATLLSTLHDAGLPPERTTSRLWANYRLLQTWDALSLSLCTSVTPPIDDEIGDVPRRPGGTDATLSIEWRMDGELRVDPFPFDAAPLVARVPTRTVPKASFDSEAALARAYYAAGREPVEFTLRPDE